MVEIGTDNQGREAIIIKDMDEYDECAAEAGSWEVLAERYKKITGTIFPPVKSPLTGLEEDGHRFLVPVRQQLVEVRNDYRQKIARFMDPQRKAYAYSEFADKRHPRVDQDPLAQTPAPLLRLYVRLCEGARPEGYDALSKTQIRRRSSPL